MLSEQMQEERERLIPKLIAIHAGVTNTSPPSPG